MRTYNLFFIALVCFFLVPFAFAQDFQAYTFHKEMLVCSSDTTQEMLVVENTGSVASFYTLSLNGKAAPFVTMAPAFFALDPGERKEITLYIRPSPVAIEGIYGLVVVLESDEHVEKQIAMDIIVERCANFRVSVDNQHITSCSGETSFFLAEFTNIGPFPETIQFSVDHLGSYTKASENPVVLPPNETGSSLIYITLPDAGNYAFKMSVQGTESKYATSLPLSLDVLDCSPEPPASKNSKLLLTIIVIAFLLIGGIIALIILFFFKEEEEEKTKPETFVEYQSIIRDGKEETEAAKKEEDAYRDQVKQAEETSESAFEAEPLLQEATTEQPEETKTRWWLWLIALGIIIALGVALFAGFKLWNTLSLVNVTTAGNGTVNVLGPTLSIIPNASIPRVINATTLASANATTADGFKVTAIIGNIWFRIVLGIVAALIILLVIVRALRRRNNGYENSVFAPLVPKKQSLSVNLQEEDATLRSVEVHPVHAAENVSLDVVSFRRKPFFAKKCRDAYAYCSMKTSMLQADISSITVRFRLEKARLGDIPSTQIRLFALDGQWVPQETRKLRADAQYYYYEARLPELTSKLYAIAPLEIPFKETNVSAGKETEKRRWWPAVLIILIILALLALLLYYGPTAYTTYIGDLFNQTNGGGTSAKNVGIQLANATARPQPILVLPSNNASANVTAQESPVGGGLLSRWWVFVLVFLVCFVVAYFLFSLFFGRKAVEAKQPPQRKKEKKHTSKKWRYTLLLLVIIGAVLLIGYFAGKVVLPSWNVSEANATAAKNVSLLLPVSPPAAPSQENVSLDPVRMKILEYITQQNASDDFSVQIWGQDTTHTLDLSDYFEDPDKAGLTYGIDEPVDNISISVSKAGQVTMVPDEGWYGIRNTLFTASDGEFTTESPVVTLVVVPEDMMPKRSQQWMIFGIVALVLVVMVVLFIMSRRSES
ncbi:hypothetical protein HZB01_01725 [Candidatus Woesearchaeota archaeon]|nr:hypothetical protein [Candidatus Woesearchaeota archaeon]